MTKYYTFFFISIAIWACSSPMEKEQDKTSQSQPLTHKYEIIDTFANTTNGTLQFTVFTPDTNWVDMENFAKKILNDKINPRFSGVAFFNPKEKTSKFMKPSSSIDPKLMYYSVAVYNFDKSQNKMVLHKSRSYLKNKEMHFN